MALYTNAVAKFIDEATPDEQETAIATYIETLDSTTEKVIAVIPYRAGVLIIAGA